MAKTVLIQTQVAAMNIDSLNSDAINTTDDLDNGSIVVRGALSTVAGKGELFTTSKPVTGSLTDLWMVYSPEVVAFKSGSNIYKGLSADPREFTNIVNYPLNIFKPMAGDLIKITGDGFTGGLEGLTAGQYAVATNASYKLGANASAIEGLTFKVLKKDDFIVIGNEHVPAALIECVRN